AGGAFTLGSNVRISTLTGADGSTIDLENDYGLANTLQVMTPGTPITLTIDQVANSTFSGQISDRAAKTTFLNVEKKGAGVLTLNQSTTAISDYRGMTKISEGIIAAPVLNVRTGTSSIGTGNAGRARNVGSADLLYIEDGAGLSFTGTTSSFSNRPFTIGVGAQGAGLYANGVGNGSVLKYQQEMLFYSDTTAEDVLSYAVYSGVDKIAFSRPNEAATLTLGGRNLGENVFAMDLHDNGVGAAAKPLSLQKSGDGNWVQGLSLGKNVTLTNCGIGEANIGDPDDLQDHSAIRAAFIITCASTEGLVSGMLVTGHPAIPPGDRIFQVLSPTQFTLLQPAIGRVSSSPGVTLTAVADSGNDFTGNTVIFLGNLAVAQNGVLGAATGANLILANCVTQSGSPLVTCASTARLVPGMALRGPTIAIGAKVASVQDATHFTMNMPAIHVLDLSFIAVTQGSNIVRTTSTENLYPGMALNSIGIPAGAKVVSIVDDSHFKIDVNAPADMGSSIIYNVSTTATSTTVTVPSTSGLQVGMTITGPAILPGTKVTQVVNGTTFNINVAATHTYNSNVEITASITARAAISGPVSVSITATGGGIVQLIGGNLDLRDVQYTSAKTLALDGGRLRSLMGNNLWAGNIINDIGSTVEEGPGSVLSLAGGISGRAGFTKIGFGTLALEGPNTFSGGFNVNEGVLQLNYTRNNVGKLSDVSGLTLGGGRKGATLDIVGNAAGSTEKVLNTTLSLGLNSITRSDPNSTTKLTSNNFIINQGATLDVQYNAAQGSAGVVVTTDRPNDGAAIGNSTGILGAWATVNLSDWAANSNNGAAPNDGSIIPYTGYKINTWEGPFANTTVTASTTQTGGTTYSLRFAAPVSTITTLVGDNTLRGGGILQAPAAGAVSNIITGGRLVLGNNNQGGNLVIQQHDTAGSLQINSDIANAKDIFVNDAISYGFNTSPQNNANNRFYLPSTLNNIDYYTGMPVLGQNVRPGSVINGFQALG
ncbi:MAG: hypothetical protein JWO08_4761, partial [Verrucomicrobiaceae bacterium]|nr:hypothetical protein [Verrucomicrobiaceae bacterium]